MKLGSDIKQAIESLALDKGVTVDSMYEALVSAFRSAYMRIEGAEEEAAQTNEQSSENENEDKQDAGEPSDEEEK